MEMQQYYGGGHDVDWSNPLSELPPLPLCLSSPPLLMSSDDALLPMAAAALSNVHGSLGDCSPPAIMPRDDVMTSCLPLITVPAPADCFYGSYALRPFPCDLATAGLDDALLMQPFTDIDLDAFADVEVKPEPDLHLDTAPMSLDFGAPPMAIVNVNPLQQNNTARGFIQADDGDSSINLVAKGYGAGAGAAAVESDGQKAEVPPRRVKRSSSEGSGAAAIGRSLDHIGFEELRKYFYMPITKAAREMNVGLTVLKKRCRELGVKRWPHRKMKSLRSLILNIQEMGKGASMSPAEVQRKLEALETDCVRMEENPAIELTEQTKKLRQACFKENYKRRRAVAGSLLDHCYGDFGEERMISRNNSQSNGFFRF